MRSLPATVGPRHTTRAMRGLLYVLTGLTFFAGTQLFVLARHTETSFSWPIEPASTAAFVGAGFWSASVISFWAARQPLWRDTRIPIPTILAVAFLLLVATLDHLETFEGLLGLAWIEVYAAFLPIMVAVVAMQLVRPGHDAPTDDPSRERCGACPPPSPWCSFRSAFCSSPIPTPARRSGRGS
jgi:hypothetical protein